MPSFLRCLVKKLLIFLRLIELGNRNEVIDIGWVSKMKNRILLKKLKEQSFKYGKSKPCLVINSKKHFTKEGDLLSWSPYWNLDICCLHAVYKDNRPIAFIDWFKRYLNKEYPDPIYLYKGGIFAVRKELILQHSLDYYKKLILEVDYHIDPIEGHFLERSWFYIFNQI